MMITMILMVIMMTKPYDYDDDTDDDTGHKNDRYTVAVAAPGASVPCSLFTYLNHKYRIDIVTISRRYRIDSISIA